VRQIFGGRTSKWRTLRGCREDWNSATLVLPYIRIVIIAFSMLVLLMMWLMLSRTRLGLFVRGVTQNRTMAACVGVPTGRVDLLASAGRWPLERVAVAMSVRLGHTHTIDDVLPSSTMRSRQRRRARPATV